MTGIGFLLAVIFGGTAAFLAVLLLLAGLQRGARTLRRRLRARARWTAEDERLLQVEARAEQITRERIWFEQAAAHVRGAR